MEYYRWTTRDLDSLMLGEPLSSVCTEALHEHCMRVNRGCTSVLKGGYTIPDRADRERVAKEAQAKCHKVKIIIVEVEQLG